MPPRPIDHLVLPVDSLKTARARYQALGFSVRENRQHPFGTANCCVFFQNNTYLEPLAVADREKAEAAIIEQNIFVRRQDAFRFRHGKGFAMLALASENADADQAAFACQVSPAVYAIHTAIAKRMAQMKPKTRPFQNSAVRAVYDQFSPEVRSRLLAIRELIFDTAKKTEGVGEIEETLKWSEPAYLTVRPKCGSTIRLNAVSNEPVKIAAYFICTTNLVRRFQEQYPVQFEYRDNRALVLDVKDDIPHEALSHCFAMALTYHLRK